MLVCRYELSGPYKKWQVSVSCVTDGSFSSRTENFVMFEFACCDLIPPFDSGAK